MTLQLPRFDSEAAIHTAVMSERLAVGQTVGAVYDGPGACDSRIDFAAGAWR
jgi:hypothetical protein